MLPVSIKEHVLTHFIQVFKALPEVLCCGKMDFFQGSSPPTFISFCLENQNVDEDQTPTNTTENIHAQSEQTLDQSSVLTANLAQDPIPTPLPHVRVVTFQDQNIMWMLPLTRLRWYNEWRRAKLPHHHW